MITKKPSSQKVTLSLDPETIIQAMLLHRTMFPDSQDRSMSTAITTTIQYSIINAERQGIIQPIENKRNIIEALWKELFFPSMEASPQEIRPIIEEFYNEALEESRLKASKEEKKPPLRVHHKSLEESEIKLSIEGIKKEHPNDPLLLDVLSRKDPLAEKALCIVYSSIPKSLFSSPYACELFERAFEAFSEREHG